jgi:putative DNA primase/helicase
MATGGHVSLPIAEELKRLRHGHYRRPCARCASEKARRNDTSMVVDVSPNGGGLAYCYRCGAGGGWGSNGKSSTPGAPPPAPVEQRHLTLSPHFREFWRSLRPVSGTAAKYLLARRCVLPPPDGHLRSTETLRHPSGYCGPGLVALVTDALTSEPLTLHRTWVRPDGTKDEVDPPRLLLGKHRKAGGVIRLFPDSIADGVGICEGIESSLSLAESFTPVWSTIDAGNLRDFPVLDGVERLVIGVDNDPAGRRAARDCANRWISAGRRVRLLVPPVEGHDINDHVRER